MRYTNPKDAYDMYKFLQEKKVFKEFYASSKPVEDPNKPLSFEDLIAQVSTTLYCFYEDDFDVYLKTIPADQVKQNDFIRLTSLVEICCKSDYWSSWSEGNKFNRTYPHI